MTIYESEAGAAPGTDLPYYFIAVIDFAPRFPPRRLGATKKIKIGLRDVEIRVLSVRFTPRGFEKKLKGNFVIFRFVVNWAW